MKAIISTTHDPLYQFFLPITTWCWNRLGVEVVCSMPSIKIEDYYFLPIHSGIYKSANGAPNLNISYEPFYTSQQKEATYAQCARLFGHTQVGNPNQGVVTSDVDMLVFKMPPIHPEDFTVWGADLVPPKQYPVCYVSAPQSK